MASWSHCRTIHALLRGKVTWRSPVHLIIVPVLRGATHRRAANLRTIIVIADIHRGLHSPAVRIATDYPPWLTFRHWSGVTPYTSSYEFAGSCVFGKQLPGKLSLRRAPSLDIRPIVCSRVLRRSIHYHGQIPGEGARRPYR